MRNHIVALMANDFRVLQSEKVMLVFALVALICGAIATASGSITGLAVSYIMIGSIGMNLFSIEEKYHTERYMASLPVKRSDIVIAKYANAFIVSIAYFALACAVCAGNIALRSPFIHFIPLSSYAAALAVIMLFTAISLPFYFRLGFGKARMITMLLVFVPIFGEVVLAAIFSSTSDYFSSLAKTMAALSGSITFPPLLAFLLLGGGLALFVGSIPVAVHLYARRDL